MDENKDRMLSNESFTFVGQFISVVYLRNYISIYNLKKTKRIYKVCTAVDREGNIKINIKIKKKIKKIKKRK